MKADSVTTEERTALEEILSALRRVRHGYVQVIVQDGRVVQIDTMEKRRLDKQKA